MHGKRAVQRKNLNKPSDVYTYQRNNPWLITRAGEVPSPGQLRDLKDSSDVVFPFSPGGPVPVPHQGDIASVTVPHQGAVLHQQQSQAGACSWDPKIFRPDHVVSCYSGLQFLRREDLPFVSLKPGIGFKKDDCGSWVRKLKSGDEYRDIYYNCRGLSCPVCMPGTLTDKARDIEERFELYEKAKLAENAVLVPGEVRGIKPRQIIFSISPVHQAELVAKMRRSLPGPWGTAHEKMLLDVYRKEEDRAVKISGLVGGVKIYHDARVKHPDTGLTGSRAKRLIILEAKLASAMTDEDPAWKLYDHIRKQKDWQRYYYLSLHSHVIGYGRLIESEEFERLMPGWKYHNKGLVSNPGGLARYLISHMAMIEDRHSRSWFGRLSPVHLGKEELRTFDEVQIHAVTGLPWMIVESVNPLEVGGTYRVTVTEYRGFFRIKQKRKNRENVLVFPKAHKRSMAPPGMQDKGILAMAAYCDEYGRM